MNHGADEQVWGWGCPLILQRILLNAQIGRRNSKKCKKLARSDIVILRYPKSGVTWMRVMISRIYQRRLGLPETAIVGRSEFRRWHADAPSLFVAMDNFGMSREELKRRLLEKKVVLLLRDPRDIVVSWYFHVSKRSTAGERAVFRIPDSVGNQRLYDFAMNPDHGMPRIIDFMNFWFDAVRRQPDAIIVKYEDLRSRPEEAFAPVIRLLQPDVTAEEIHDAVEYAEFSRMKKREGEGSFGLDILQPGIEGDDDSFKVRRGKVKGYVDYFSAEERRALDRVVHERLHPDLGYSRSGELPQPASSVSAGAAPVASRA